MQNPKYVTFVYIKYTLFLFFLSKSVMTAVDLPLCPTGFPFLPQKLPMHCRMPTIKNLTFPQIPGFPPMFNNPSLPFPITGMMPPGIPPSLSMPGPMPGPMSLPSPLPGPMPMPMPMPLPPPVPGMKLPVIVMPFYAPDQNTKPPTNYDMHDTSSSDADTDSSSDTEGMNSDNGWWRRKHRLRTHGKKGKHFRRMFKTSKRSRHGIRRRNKNLVTPILQYVTKDGYVIYQKKISSPEAKEWLNLNKEQTQNTPVQIQQHYKNNPETLEYESYENDNNSFEDKRDTEKNTKVKLNIVHKKNPNLQSVPKKASQKKYKQ